MSNKFILEGVTLDPNTNQYIFDFYNDDKVSDIIHLTVDRSRKRLNRVKDLYYFSSYTTSKNIDKGLRDKFLRDLKSKKISQLDYNELITVGVSLLNDFIDLNNIDVILMPKSSSPLLTDIISEVQLYIDKNKTKIYKDYFIKNSIDNIILDYDKFKDSKPSSLNSFNKQYQNAISTGEFKIKDIKFIPFRRLIKNFLTINKDITNTDPSDIDNVANMLDSNILVIDDIITSNTTLMEMNRILKELSPRSITGYVLIN